MDFALRELVRQQAGRRCEYCRIHEDDKLYAFHLEHVVPKKHGGGDDPSILAWSCHSCNLAKGANLSGRVHGEIVTLFHPRRQQWNRHFVWNADGTLIVGLTVCGRATVVSLQLNNLVAVNVRREWVKAGWHPPEDED